MLTLNLMLLLQLMHNVKQVRAEPLKSGYSTNLRSIFNLQYNTKAFQLFYA
jgi:hypothetical protein